jgi:hypothetical protein
MLNKKESTSGPQDTSDFIQYTLGMRHGTQDERADDKVEVIFVVGHVLGGLFKDFSLVASR